jgi:hypothetical protein
MALTKARNRMIEGAEVNILDFGAVNDGSAYINSAWAAAMEQFSDGKGGKLLIPEGTYLVKPSYRTSIGTLADQLQFPYDNVTVELRGNLQVETNGNRYIALLFGRQRGSTSSTANHVSNIQLIGSGKIIGDRSTHTVADTNFGFGIYIANCKNSRIDGTIQIENIYGDGIYVDALPYGPADGENNSNSVCINTSVNGCTTYNNYRNNVSILNNDGIIFDGHIADSANGASPQAGFDVEPDYTDVPTGFYCRSVKILNSKAINNIGSGIEVPDTSPGTIDSVLIEGCYVKNNGTSSNGFGGIRIISRDGVGSAKIIGNEVLDNYGLGIDIDGNNQGTVNADRNVIVANNFVSGTLEGTKESIQMGYGISVRKGVVGAIIEGNIVQKCAHHGIYVESISANSNDDILINGNSVWSNSQQTDNTYDNIKIGTYVTLTNVTNNFVRKEIASVAVTNKPKYGINVGSDYVNLLNNNVYQGGSTAEIIHSFAATGPKDTSRNSVVKGNFGYVNQQILETAAFSIGSTGSADITITHGLDNAQLSNATLAEYMRSQIQLTVVADGAVTGNPVVVPFVRSLDATNITIGYTIVTAGTGNCRIVANVTTPY